MKKFFFILSFFSCIRAMQETEKKLALLPPEMLEEMRQKKVKKDAYSTHINFDKPVIFSTNHTQIHYSETPEEQPCFNVLGWHDLASGLMNFEYNKDENQRLNNIVAYDIKCTNDVHMDGPNDSGCIIIGTNRAIESPDGDTIDYKSNYCLVSRHNAKKNTHVCWCNPQNARFERVQFRSDPKLCAITALALYKKTNVFSVAYTMDNSQYVEVYNADNIEAPILRWQYSFCLVNPDDAIKKISIITPNLLVALSKVGHFMILGINKDQTITKVTQHFKKPQTTFCDTVNSLSRFLLFLCKS